MEVGTLFVNARVELGALAIILHHLRSTEHITPLNWGAKDLDDATNRDTKRGYAPTAPHRARPGGVGFDDYCRHARARQKERK